MRDRPNKRGCYACPWTYTALPRFPVAIGPCTAVPLSLPHDSSHSSATPPTTTPEPTPTQVALAAEADLISRRASVPSAHPAIESTPATKSSPSPTANPTAKTTATHNPKPNTPTAASIAPVKRTPSSKTTPTAKPAAPPTVLPSRVVSTVPRLPKLASTPCKKPSPLGRQCVTAPSPPTSKITTTPATTKQVTPKCKTIPNTPDVKVAAGINGLINRSAATGPSSPSRSPKLVAAQATKSSPPPVEAAVAAESVPSLISRVSAASAVSSSSRLPGTAAIKLSPAQVGATRSPVIGHGQKGSVSDKVHLAKQTSPRASSASPVRKPNKCSLDAQAAAKPKREPSTLLSNPKLHKLLRNPGSRKEIKASRVLMYKQRPIRL
ncbi:hypothetical protein BJ741DRAFT_632461 [Chytriomyces cf. hyalinus JEL632]|nr:hypothetical protein BJ741DRAFT_632461 [Chytriomyces cf. hyalinus JEL632]